MPRMKIVWRVNPEPTGFYRTFGRRNWPSGEGNGVFALSIRCTTADAYTPDRARGKQSHGPLIVLVTDRRHPTSGEGAWRWRKILGEFATLKEAKEAGAKFLNAHPEILDVQI